MVGNQRRLGDPRRDGCAVHRGVAVTYWAEANGTSGLSALGLTSGNMEGRKSASASFASSLFAVITTAASCGAVQRYA